MLLGPGAHLWTETWARASGAAPRLLFGAYLARHRHQVPHELASLIAYLFTEALDGRNARVTDGVQRALGRTPRDFADYARTASSTGVWDRARGRPE